MTTQTSTETDAHHSTGCACMDCEESSFDDEIIDPEVYEEIARQKATLPAARCPFYNRTHNAHPYLGTDGQKAWCAG